MKGMFHGLLLDEKYRVPYLSTSGRRLDGSSWTQSSALTTVASTGALQEAGSSFPMSEYEARRVVRLLGKA